MRSIKLTIADSIEAMNPAFTRASADADDVRLIRDVPEKGVTAVYFRGVESAVYAKESYDEIDAMLKEGE